MNMAASNYKLQLHERSYSVINLPPLLPPVVSDKKLVKGHTGRKDYKILVLPKLRLRGKERSRHNTVRDQCGDENDWINMTPRLDRLTTRILPKRGTGIHLTKLSPKLERDITRLNGQMKTAEQTTNILPAIGIGDMAQQSVSVMSNGRQTIDDKLAGMFSCERAMWRPRMERQVTSISPRARRELKNFSSWKGSRIEDDTIYESNSVVEKKIKSYVNPCAKAKGY